MISGSVTACNSASSSLPVKQVVFATLSNEPIGKILVPRDFEVHAVHGTSLFLYSYTGT